jgi:hypothetical protein
VEAFQTELQRGQERVRWRLRLLAIFGAVLVSAALALVVIGPAGAQTNETVMFSGPVTAGETLTLTCPEGTHLAGPASATFFYSPNLRGVIVTAGPDDLILDPTTGLWVGASWTVPIRARSAEAVIECMPSTTTVTASGVFGSTATQPVIVWCPVGYPIVVSAEVVLLNPPSGGTQPIDYTVTPEGNAITFVGPEGYSWQATVTCTV